MASSGTALRSLSPGYVTRTSGLIGARGWLL